MNEVVKQAAVQLCREFTARIKEDGFEVAESSGADFSVQIKPSRHGPYFGRPVILLAVDEGKIIFLKLVQIGSADRKAVPLPLTYNQRTGLFEGAEGGDALKVMVTVFRDLKPEEP